MISYDYEAASVFTAEDVLREAWRRVLLRENSTPVAGVACGLKNRFCRIFRAGKIAKGVTSSKVLLSVFHSTKHTTEPK